MTNAPMPTTLPSPTDRDEYHFVAVDAAGRAWRWVDKGMVLGARRRGGRRR